MYRSQLFIISRSETSERLSPPSVPSQPSHHDLCDLARRHDMSYSGKTNAADESVIISSPRRCNGHDLLLSATIMMMKDVRGHVVSVTKYKSYARTYNHPHIASPIRPTFLGEGRDSWTPAGPDRIYLDLTGETQRWSYGRFMTIPKVIISFHCRIFHSIIWR